MLVVNRDKCVGCGLCVTFCPRDALKSWGVCQIDVDKCNDCLICIDYCPADALVVAEERRK